jgi:hypothetical protein
MGNIDGLPQETLLLVFTKGMEDELYESKACLRKMKTFACLARNVCRHWRVLIDDPIQTSFWIARSFVSMSGPERQADRKPLAKDLADFQAQLLTSEGCDLAITFRTAMPSKSEQQMELRLMIHALYLLTPYQSQLVQFRLEGDHTDLTAYLFEHITSHWKMAQRLLEIWIEIWGPYETISQMRDRSSFGILQSRKPTRMSLPINMTHLKNLDLLRISSALWLNYLTLPHTLRHLELSYVDFETIQVLHRYLLQNQVLCNNLRSISLEGKGFDLQNRGTTWKPEGPLILPHLLKLQLGEQAAAGWEMATFLGNLICPSLDILILFRLYRDFAELELATTGPSTPQSIENASRILHTAATHGDDGGDVRLQAVPFLPQFSPVHLTLLSVPYADVLFVLISLDTQCLEGLHVSNKGNVGELPAIDESVPALTALGQRIFMPRLRTLRCDVTLAHLVHFITHLSAPNLFSMKIWIVENASRPVDESFQDHSLTPFTSMATLNIEHSSSTALFILFKLLRPEVLPNLRELGVESPGNYVPERPSELGRSVFEDFIIPLCRFLGPTVEGSVPFPTLRFLDIAFDFEMRKPKGWELSIRSEAAIRALIDSLLTDRVRSGALPLYKDTVSSICGYSNHTSRSVNLVKIKASSNPATVEG